MPNLTRRPPNLTPQPRIIRRSQLPYPFKHRLQGKIMKRSTLLASTAALLLSAGVAVAAGEAAKQQPANDMPPPPHGDRPKPHHSDKMRNKFKRDSLPRGFDELGLSEVQKKQNPRHHGAAPPAAA